MIKGNKLIIGALILFLAAVFVVPLAKNREGKTAGRVKEIKPVIGDVKITVKTTGVVEPQNRLEIKPSVNGRIEEMLVKEGDRVKNGDTLAWMSSAERVALIDAARSQGGATLGYWEEVYKKTPVISPIDGEVIVRSVEPGQTVTTADAILVLSDRLVVNAQFDETDIGRVKVGQKASITLDAYPEVKLEGTVDHIAYESKVVNNVTIYDVDVLPQNIPDIMRSGMSVSVEVIENEQKDVITIPSAAIHYDGKQAFVMLKQYKGLKISERNVEIGLNNDKTAEVVSGLTAEDTIVMPDTSYSPKKPKIESSPFMPFGGRR